MKVRIFRNDDEAALLCVIPHDRVIGGFKPYISNM